MFPTVVSVDLSEQMLRQAAGRSPTRIQADASHLPLANASVAAVAAVDMLLFPAETARVLRPDGVLPWINQLAADGPLHLPAAAVAGALPGTWEGIESEAGWGTWVVLRRSSWPEVAGAPPRDRRRTLPWPGPSAPAEAVDASRLQALFHVQHPAPRA
ncbi:hypothetical protein GCM10010193_06820 [Kitasatospora atroaurantiaca]|uniref:Methyltransferase family protein n=2 Tax=Kitasatospora atroaurantiaca TaxID=285545 RepID=A0A561EJ57_9ACTN|nr:methyltransferase family protein [Kitasatospora atroaurantiaca]